MGQSPLRVIIADDHRIFLEGVKSVLDKVGSFCVEVVGEAVNGQEALELVREHPVDLLLLDLNMPVMDGLQVLAVLQAERRKKIKTIVLTMYDDPRIVKSAFKRGAKGFLLKRYAVDELEPALIEVMSGRPYLGTGVKLLQEKGMEPIVARPRLIVFPDGFVDRYRLTRRELEVLKLITQALSNKEIAKSLYISDQTVSVHRKNIMRKLGVTNTASLIKMAYDYSLV